MAILANSARGMPPRIHRAYRLEMSGRTLLTLLSLFVLTGLVVFYLGVLTGKGLRDPNATTAAAPTPGGAPGAAAGTAGSPGGTANLAFNQALTAPNAQIEGLKSDQARLSEQTSKLMTQARKELELEEVPVKSSLAAQSNNMAPAASKPAAPAAPPAVSMAAAPQTPRPAAPKAAAAVAPAPKPAAPSASKTAAPAAPKAVTAPAAAPEGMYTVQVFSSTNQRSAQELMATLKKKGFPAYLNQFQAEDKKTWYRVRVGKGTKAEAEALAARLKQDGAAKAPRVMQQ